MYQENKFSQVLNHLFTFTYKTEHESEKSGMNYQYFIAYSVLFGIMQTKNIILYFQLKSRYIWTLNFCVQSVYGEKVFWSYT